MWRVKIIEKVNNAKKPNGYRPIKTLPVLEKLLEKVVFYQLSNQDLEASMF